MKKYNDALNGMLDDFKTTAINGCIMFDDENYNILQEATLKASAFDVIKKYMIRDSQHINIMSDIFSDENDFKIILEAFIFEEALYGRD